MIRLFALLMLLAGPLAAQVIVDNGAAGYSEPSGTWTGGTSATGKYGADYRFASTVGSAGPATATAEWRPNLSAGDYEVATWYPSGSNRANDAPFRVTHAGGTSTVRINQTLNGGQWRVLGTFTFSAGTGGFVTLGNDAESAKVVLADAVRFTPVTFANDEFRGVWVSRFEWPSTTPATWKANLDTILGNAKAGNFNTVLLQMRGTTETFYPSPHEPLAAAITLGTGDDPLQYAINAAHALGLKLHLYFNTHVCTASFASTHQSWLIADNTGTPISSTVDGYYWLAPGHPEVQTYLRAQIMHVVNNYPTLDGIHFDRIRMPEPDYSHDAVSDARRTGRGNPGSLGFGPWTADQITRFLRDVYAEVHSVNPNLQLSAAPLGLYQAASYPGYSTGYYYGLPRHQDAKAWLAAGALDWIAPQIYWPDDNSNPDFSEILPDWLAGASGRHIYPGMSATGDGNANETIAEITASRNLGAPGTVVWSYGAANSYGFWSALTQAGAPYQQPANPPDMPWLSNSGDAIVYGFVSSFATGLPVADAWINVNGQSYTAVSAHDGFWCWLKLAPGTYTFSADDPGAGSASIVVSNLQAGEVRRVDLALAPAGTATRIEVQNAPTGNVKPGDDFAVTVRITDAFGTLVTAGTHTVNVTHIGSGTLTGSASQTTGGGYATFTLQYDLAQTITLTFIDAAGTLTQTSVPVTISTKSKKSGGGEDGGGCSLGTGGPSLALVGVALIALALFARRRRAACAA